MPRFVLLKMRICSGQRFLSKTLLSLGLEVFSRPSPVLTPTSKHPRPLHPVGPKLLSSGWGAVGLLVDPVYAYVYAKLHMDAHGQAIL